MVYLYVNQRLNKLWKEEDRAEDILMDITDL